jgi:hypothetical protein
VQSPVTYWFDDARINTALPAAASDLKAHVRAAANDWATKTGITFTEVTPGTGKVRIYASGAILWPEWNTAGKERITSHEWGHVLGFGDVTESGCSRLKRS